MLILTSSAVNFLSGPPLACFDFANGEIPFASHFTSISRHELLLFSRASFTSSFASPLPSI